MTRLKYNDSEIMSILKQESSGIPVANVLREHNISSATFYKWRSRYGGMDLPMISKLKELEVENARLKKMYAEKRLRADILKEVLKKRVLYEKISLAYCLCIIDDLLRGKTKADDYTWKLDHCLYQVVLAISLFPSKSIATARA